ncbi:MAG: sn-glycerol-3-phosphate ABC transporter ATP-binding protein UgpC [Chloroflexi bacterium]|nr:sn-glycerol-3-phosphate ABC transporter ATP-binding protein UgpC [Chloroflexota bacterium]MBU1746237.1 sn-glycerol-3-phosphate ABC transporter ATP-binding protein UgpC [Chloroflexota bacterium]MBU1880257.1 sn-glycerol-3-phosphate ABC transporter ATP-binding protein UgpC [Chloroflexota bacterium]
MSSVTYEHATKRFGNVTAVNDLSIEVADKEFLVLVGPSGCGKSTALRMLAGLEEITEGNIYIGDRLVNDVAPKDRDIAMVFQSYALYPHMSVYDNMAFGLKLRKTPKQDIERRVQEAADILGIHQLLDRKPKALSGGQRQRVALGRAIVREPAVFLMDEPLSNLDAKLRVQTRAEISKLHQRLQTTIIYVTHDQVEAMTMGSRIAVLKDGLLLQCDAPQVLYEKPANVFVAGFIGSPAMDFFDGKLVGTQEEMYLETATFKVRVPPEKAARLSSYLGKKIVFGIRPEDIMDRRQLPDAPDDLCFTVKVDVVELMGSEYYLYLVTGDQTFVGRVEYRNVIHPGDELQIALNMDHMHAFDSDTTFSLTS